MKKIVSLLLCFLLLFTVAAPLAGAEEKDTSYPTVIVAGYSSSNLYLDGEKVWHINSDDILSAVLHNIAKIGLGLGELAFRQPQYLADLVGKEVLRLTKYIACNPDGSSVYPLVTWPADAEHTQSSFLYENYDGDNIHEGEIMGDIASEYGPDGLTQIFNYQQDFRRGMLDCAADLDKYIDSVLAFTGKDKVNIYAVSHGGQTVAAYLALYGVKKNVVNNAVLTVPAIGGAALAYDVMSEEIVFDEETLVVFVENGQMLETDFNWLVKAKQFGILDDLFRKLVHNYVKKVVGYWGSMWDFIPMEYYDQLKNDLLDPVESAELIRKSDEWHYTVMPHMGESLRACLDAGINIYIVAGTSIPSVTGLQEQSDGIITTHDSTGAKTAPYGKRFSDGYVCTGEACTDPSHQHLSPEMTVDASWAFLPEQTWYINGYLHGMTWKDDHLVDLCKTLVFSGDRVDVHTYKEFPQFDYSHDRNYSVLASFDDSPIGYWSGRDSRLVVKNLSYKYKMRVASVAVNGADVRFDLKRVIYLDPRESCEIALVGSIPAVSATTADVTVYYSLLGSVTPSGYRTMTFSLNNGPAPAYDASKPYTDALHASVFETNLSETSQNILSKLGIFDFLKMIVNRFMAIIRSLRLF